MHATRPTTRPLVAPTRGAHTPRAAAPRRAAPLRAATSYSAPSKAGGATALDIIRRHSEVVPDTVLLGNRGTVDVPTAATVSAAVLAGLVANPGAGVREYQVRECGVGGAGEGRGRRAQAGLRMAPAFVRGESPRRSLAARSNSRAPAPVDTRPPTSACGVGWQLRPAASVGSGVVGGGGAAVRTPRQPGRRHRRLRVDVCIWPSHRRAQPPSLSTVPPFG